MYLGVCFQQMFVKARRNYLFTLSSIYLFVNKILLKKRQYLLTSFVNENIKLCPASHFNQILYIWATSKEVIPDRSVQQELLINPQKLHIKLSTALMNMYTSYFPFHFSNILDTSTVPTTTKPTLNTTLVLLFPCQLSASLILNF